MARHDIVVIGASAGGVEALIRLVRELPARLNAALLLVLHVPPDSPSVLPRILTRAGSLPATNPVDGEPIQRGHIYIAPPDRHLLVERGTLRVSAGPREHGHRPAVDPLFRTAAHAYGPRVLGIVLSGNLNDGTAGLSEIVHAGGAAIVQLPEESLFPGMPKTAAEYVPEARRLSIQDIGRAIVQMAAAPATSEREVISTIPDFTSRDPISHVGNGVGDDPDPDRVNPDMAPERLPEAEYGGPPSTFTCPECHGTLWELRDGELFRYRCRVGHAYTGETLSAAQDAELEAALWTALRMFEEHVTLLERMQQRVAERGGLEYAISKLEQRTQDTRRRAEVLRTVLTDRGSVEPEDVVPSPNADA